MKIRGKLMVICKTKAIFCTKLFINHYLFDDAMADDVCHNFLTT